MQGQPLEDRARDSGVPLRETIDLSGGHAVLRESGLQRQVLEAERSLREHRVWWLALVRLCGRVGDQCCRRLVRGDVQVGACTSPQDSVGVTRARNAEESAPPANHLAHLSHLFSDRE